MTPSKRATPEELELLYRTLAAQTDTQVIAALLEDMCTIREINEMAQRLTLAKYLAAERSYNSISEETGASATTIARVSKALHYGKGGYKIALEQEKQEKQEEEREADSRQRKNTKSKDG